MASLADFDLVHFYGLYDLLGPSVGQFCRKNKLPYVIEPMGMFRPIDRSFRKKRLWQQTLGRSFWRGAARIIATSELEEAGLNRSRCSIRESHPPLQRGGRVSRG